MKFSWIGAALFVFLPCIVARADEPLETETARFPAKGTKELSLLGESQSSSTGRESIVPLAFEYGMKRNLTLLIEPVLGTKIRPKFGRIGSGVGDTEVTLTRLIAEERRHRPAFAFAGEVKLPTAKDRLVGTGKTDFAFYAIASKRYSRLDAHFNLGYTIVGQSVPGVKLKNLTFAALGGDYNLSPKFDLVSEVYGNTSSSPEAADGNGAGTPITTEVAGSETVGMLGVRYRADRSSTYFLAFTRDNQKANLFRFGITRKL